MSAFVSPTASETIAVEPYRPDMQEALLAFLTRCLPESGRAFDPEGGHAHLLDVERTYEAFCVSSKAGKWLAAWVCSVSPSASVN